MLRKDKEPVMVDRIVSRIAGAIVHEVELFDCYNARQLINAAKLLGLPILWLEQNPEKLGTNGACIARGLDLVRTDTDISLALVANSAFVDAVKSLK